MSTFLPADDFPVGDLEAALAADEADDLIVVETDERTPIGKSWKFDFQNNRFFPSFHPGYGHGPLATYGNQTLYGWIEKCLRTDRGAHPVHPPEYGLVRAFDWFGQPVGHLSSDLEARISDALTFHPRITAVRDFVHDYEPDDEFVEIEFTVVLDDNTTLPFAVTL